MKIFKSKRFRNEVDIITFESIFIFLRGGPNETNMLSSIYNERAKFMNK